MVQYDNLGKVLWCLGISLGNFAPYTVMMSFSTQIYKQIQLFNLGFYILAIVAVASALICLVGPGIVLRLGAKKCILLASCGMSVWVSCYSYPIYCNNMSTLGEGLCNIVPISIILLAVSFVGGCSFQLLVMSIFSYVTSWANEGSLAFYQSLFYSVVVIGRVVTSIALWSTMTSKFAQTIFFFCMAAVSILSSFLFIFLPSTPIKEDSEKTLARPPPSLKHRIIQTLKLIKNKKMLLFIPFLFYLSLLKETKVGAMPVILHNIMGNEGRLLVNRRTAFIATCDSSCGVIFGIIMGKVVPVIGKRAAGLVSYGLGLATLTYLLILYYGGCTFGAEWFLVFVYMMWSLGLGLILQYCILAMDFPMKEIAFGTANFLSAILSAMILLFYSFIQIEDFYVAAVLFYAGCVLGIVAFLKIDIRNFRSSDAPLPTRFQC